MKTIISKETVILSINSSNSLSNGFDIEIENDVVKQYVRCNVISSIPRIDETTEFVPFKINTQKPFKSITLDVLMNFDCTEFGVLKVKINSNEIFTEGNKPYVHRNSIFPPYIKGDITFFPSSVLNVKYMDGELISMGRNTNIDLQILSDN